MEPNYEALYDIEEFYQPKKPSKKDGIGHEVEHIKGVILRTEEIAKIVSKEPEKYGLDEPIDLQLACYIAALHDIGNAISRSDHNHLGCGIINGKLTIDDILSVPFEINNQFISEKERERALLHYTKDGFDLSKLDRKDKTRQIILEVAKIQSKFFIGYEGRNVNDRQSAHDFLKERFKGIDNLTLKHCIDTVVDKGGDMSIKYNPKLKGITKSISNVYGIGSDELKILSQAVQDHNVDFCGTKDAIERYQARNIYGSIISDADKDNVPETFALRTFAFALNKSAKGDKSENGYYKKKDAAGNPVYTKNYKNVAIDLEKCLEHILHQANERFRPSLEENGGKIMPIFIEAVLYKKKIEKIKPVIPNPSGVHKYTYPNGKTVAYDITTNRGDDLYSQLDAISGDNEILNLRKDFIDTVQKWGNPEYFEENMKLLIETTLKTFIASNSIEHAVDIAESKYWGMSLEGFTFKDVINRVLNEAQEEETEDIDEVDLDEIIAMYVADKNDEENKQPEDIERD